MITTVLLAAALTAPVPIRHDIVLRSAVAVEGAILRLVDIADLDSLRRVDPWSAQRLSRVLVAVVRMGQAEQEIEVDTVARLARHSAPAIVGKVTADNGASRILVRSALRQLDSAAMSASVTARFLDTCRTIAEDCHATAWLHSGEAVRVPPGVVTLHPALPARWVEGAQEMDVPVRVDVDDVSVGVVRVKLTWQASRAVWVLQSAVDRGAAIRSRDVRQIVQDVSTVERDALAYDAQRRVVRATRSLESGAVLATSDARVLAEFRRGDDVNVAWKLGPVTVQRSAKALEYGHAGAKAFVQLDARSVASALVVKDKSDDSQRSGGQQ